MQDAEKVEIGYTLPKERWQEAAKNLEDLGTSHAKFQLVSAEKAAENGSVPMHPGAEKYYKEIGLL